MSEKPVFDTVENTEDHRRMTVSEFLALPMHERVGMILEQKVRFYRGQEVVDMRTALQSLMDRHRS
jgi:hypothetical protein